MIALTKSAATTILLILKALKAKPPSNEALWQAAEVGDGDLIARLAHSGIGPNSLVDIDEAAELLTKQVLSPSEVNVGEVLAAIERVVEKVTARTMLGEKGIKDIRAALFDPAALAALQARARGPFHCTRCTREFTHGETGTVVRDGDMHILCAKCWNPEVIPCISDGCPNTSPLTPKIRSAIKRGQMCQECQAKVSGKASGAQAKPGPAPDPAMMIPNHWEDIPIAVAPPPARIEPPPPVAWLDAPPLQVAQLGVGADWAQALNRVPRGALAVALMDDPDPREAARRQQENFRRFLQNGPAARRNG